MFQPERVVIQGNRYIDIPKANLRYRVAWLEFSTICEEDRGASDYQALCRNFDVIFLHGIPKMSIVNHDRARRFITFVDEVYDAGCRLFWTADDVPTKILLTTDPADDILDANVSLGTDHAWKKDISSEPVPECIDVVNSGETVLNEPAASSTESKNSSNTGNFLF